MSHERKTTLRLSAAAIERILGTDPEFKLELQRAVVAEVVGRLMPKDLNEVVFGAIQTSTRQARNEINAAGIDARAISIYADKEVTAAISAVASRVYAGAPSKARMEELSGAVDRAISNRVSTLLTEKTGTIAEALDARAQAMLGRIEGHIAKDVERVFEKQVDKLIEDRVAERLAAIKAAL